MAYFTTVTVLLLVGTARSETQGYFYHLRMQAGDVISCHLTGLLGALGSKHWMLATGPDTVIHAVTSGFFSMSAYIREMKRFAVTEGNKYSCQNWGKNYNLRTRHEAVASARENKDNSYFYNGIFCNCQHWVNKWTKGAGGFSTSSAMWAMPLCSAY
ncbi:hypothetical protein J6590_043175 [Homalodisca vitripennis]|nr:hypothetical protein J6590_043175 [Homalodisca vitripennis]